MCNVEFITWGLWRGKVVFLPCQPVRFQWPGNWFLKAFNLEMSPKKRKSYRCFFLCVNPLTMSFKKFVAKGLPSISGPPYVFIIIFLYHFFFGCSCWCLLVEEQEDLCECTWCCHCLVGFLWVAWIPLGHSGLPYPNTLSGCPFPVVQCIHIY